MPKNKKNLTAHLITTTKNTRILLAYHVANNLASLGKKTFGILTTLNNLIFTLHHAKLTKPEGVRIKWRLVEISLQQGMDGREAEVEFCLCLAYIGNQWERFNSLMGSEKVPDKSKNANFHFTSVCNTYSLGRVVQSPINLTQG